MKGTCLAMTVRKLTYKFGRILIVWNGNRMTLQRISEAIAAISPLDEAAMQAARARQDRLTKPRGSLGRLEELSIQLAGITGTALPRTTRKAVVVLAADHGVTAEGVSAYPADVTAQMALNFV